MAVVWAAESEQLLVVALDAESVAATGQLSAVVSVAELVKP